jgi:3-oxoacyl-[acyl-carrier-protein] synthase II
VSSAHSLREPIAVTGIGVTCPLGTTLPELIEHLLQGRSGVGPIRSFDASRYPVRQACEVERIPDPAGEPLERHADRAERLLVAACESALGQAGHAPGERTGLALGTTLGGLRLAGEFLRRWRDSGGAEPDVAWIAHNFPANQQALLAARFRFLGPSLSINNACASGADALGLARRWLLRGDADLVVAGGYDPLAEFTYAGFLSLKLVTETSCRPFAPDRDGFHLGEGAALFALERASTARARGARVLGWFLGYGTAAEAHHLTQPEPEGHGGARAIRAALADAGVAADAIVHVNVHGTASAANDLSEYRALRQVFGDGLHGIPVTASKGALGHTLGAAGAVEAAVALGTLQRGRIPPTLNTTSVDPAFAGLDVVRGAARELAPGLVLSNSFGFGGSCASLVFGAARDGL